MATEYLREDGRGGCNHDIEFWQEVVFETVFDVKGCKHCSAFWAWSDGEWIDSTDYWQYITDLTGAH
jgi:hypothetical protein